MLQNLHNKYQDKLNIITFYTEGKKENFELFVNYKIMIGIFSGRQKEIKVIHTFVTVLTTHQLITCLMLKESF